MSGYKYCITFKFRIVGWSCDIDIVTNIFLENVTDTKLLKIFDALDYHSLTHIDVCCRSATPDCGGVIKEDCILTKSQAHISLERPILKKIFFVKKEMLQEIKEMY